MSATGSGIQARDEARLHAYHDGELSGLARWWFARRLARSPELARELALLETMRELVMEHDAARETPDLWDAIALRLPAVEAQRAEAERSGRAGPLSLLLRPLGAVAAAAAVAVVVFQMLAPVDSVAPGVVRWIDSGARSVIVLDDDEEMTIIWVLDGQSEGASRGGSGAIS